MQLKNLIGLSRFETVSSYKRGAQAPLQARHTQALAFTIMEVLVVMALLLMLTIAAISALTLLDRSSLRQAQHTTALEVAQGQLDQILATAYVVPSAMFNSSNYTTTNTTAILTTGNTGTNATTVAIVTTKVEPVLNGHVATVIVQYTNYNQPTSVRLQTLINKLSGGQP